jgi:RNA polymerase sigma-70 factor (ECF subfamily)
MLSVQRVLPTTSLTVDSPTLDAAAAYKRYARRLFVFILQRVGDPAVAEELVQDVFERMLIALPHYEERGYPLSAWLYKIAACRAVDWLRKNSRRRLYSLELAVERPGEAWPDGDDTAADRQAEQRAILAALAQLPERQAEVLRLRFFDELPLADVAAQLDLSLGSVKALQHRGVAQLRSMLTHHPVFEVA